MAFSHKVKICYYNIYKKETLKGRGPKLVSNTQQQPKNPQQQQQQQEDILDLRFTPGKKEAAKQFHQSICHDVKLLERKDRHGRT